jgi:hypothetical protein
MLSFHIGPIDCDISEVDAGFIKQDVPEPLVLSSSYLYTKQHLLAVLIKNSTSVDQLGFLLWHCFSPSFGIEDPLIIVVSQRGPEVLVEALLINLLQAQNVGVMGSQLCQNSFSTVFP